MASNNDPTMIPAARFWTIIGVVLILAICGMWMTYLFGEIAGQQDCRIDEQDAVIAQLKKDNKIRDEESNKFNSMSHTDYLLQH